MSQRRLLSGGLFLLVSYAVTGAAEIAWVPVGATGPHVLSGNKIILPYGGMFVTFEARVSDWDPSQSGQSRLKVYQVHADTSGFSAGEGGPLELRSLTCNVDEDCFSGITCGHTVPGVCDDTDPNPKSWFYVDIFHPEYVFTGLQSIATTDSANVRLGGVVLNAPDSVLDPGAPRYGGTLVVYVPEGASGTFELGILPRPESFLIAYYDGSQWDLPLEFAAGQIVVGVDCNNNGVSDSDDITNGTSADCNHNDIPDECEQDCNDNGNPDDCDIAQGCSMDCNGNAVPDDCEPDCNGNGIADSCDVAGGTSEDCDQDSVPDECHPTWHQDCDGNDNPDWCDVAVGGAIDCNENGVPDACDVAGGASLDCDGNDVPDECEPDCNGNGVADACDIDSGFSSDADQDGVPDDCTTGFALIPVGASRGHTISGNEIRVPVGASSVTLEGLTFGWDPDMDGDPRLSFYQFLVLVSSFSSGTSGTLTVANVPCATDADCRHGLRCGVPDPGVCETQGTNSSAAYIDVFRDDFVFAGSSTSADAAVDDVHATYGGLTHDPVFSVEDDGGRAYAGTLVLDVPEDARGTFRIALSMDTAHVKMRDQTGADLVLQTFGPALITIVEDCNGNGVLDTDDIAGGTSVDCDQNGFPDECDLAYDAGADCNDNFVPDVCESAEDCNENGTVDFCDLLAGTSADENGNGIPDECEAITPISEASGARYLLITPAGMPDVRVALRVSSPDFPCLTKYVSDTGGATGLSDNPTYLTAGEWGTVTVGDDAIVPSAVYEVVADRDDGVASAPAVMSTPSFGDLVPPFGTVDFRDIAGSVQAFLAAPCAPTTEQADLAPAVPDGIVDFRDIMLVVAAYVGDPYPYAAPCP